MTDILDFLRRVNESAGGTMPAWGIVPRVTVLLSAALLVALVLRRSSAALRHLVWTLSLVGTLLVPLCSWVLPAWQWAVLPQRQPSPPSVAPVAKDAPPSPVVAPRTEDIPLRSAHSPRPFAGRSPLPAAASADQPVEVPTTPPATVADHPTPPPVPQPKWSWPMFLAVAWAAGSFLGLVWLGIGITAAWYVARRADPAADPCWGEILRQLLDPCGIRRPVEVRECPQVSVPMTWGLFRPVILVPAGSAAWPEEIKRSVLLHELGHIRRGDCPMLLLGRLACAAYWFHPLAWLAARQLRKTAEQAADDLVLASNIAPPDYAEHLVGIAARMRGLHLFGHVALPMASPSDLEGRVRAILDPRRNHRSLKRKTCYGLMFLAVLLVIPCAILRLGYAEDKKPPEPAATSKDGPAAQPAAEKRPFPNPDDRAARPELVLAEAKYNVAKSRAEDDIDIRYAVAGAAVAKAEYEINKKTNEKIPGSVPPERLNELALKWKEMDLAIEKARLDQRIAREEAEFARAEFEAVKHPDDAKVQREMEVVKAEAKYHVAKIRADDDINVRYAAAAAVMAKAEYDINKKTDAVVPGSVPKERLNELSLKSKEAELAIEKAKRDQRVAGEEAKVAKAELEAAKRKAADEHSAPAPTKGTSESGPAKAGTTNDPQPALLTAFGKVLDPAGKPLAGATVYLREWSKPNNRNFNDILATAQTDAQGAFRFEKVAARPFDVELRGIVPWDVVVVARPYALAWRHLTAAHESKPLTITMAPAAKITGQVTDQQGRPVRNTKVKVDLITPLADEFDLRPDDLETLDLASSRLEPVAKTDADGKVTIAGLPRDRLLFLAVTQDDFRSPFFSDSLLVATTDEPQADIKVPWDDADVPDGRPHKVFSSAFSAVLEPPLPRIAGRVLAADSKKPLARTRVECAGAPWATLTDQDGRFTARVPKMPCLPLVFTPEDGAYLARLVHVDVPQGKRETQVDVELDRGQVLSGRVVDAETRKGVSDVNVAFDNGLYDGRFNYKPAVDGPIPSSAKTDGAGRFRLAVPPGKGKVKILGPDSPSDLDQEAARRRDFNEYDFAGSSREVEVVAGKPVADVTLAIHRAERPAYVVETVEGIVIDAEGKPVSGAEVGSISHFGNLPGGPHPVRTDREGHFSFQQRLDFGPLIAIHKGRRLRGHVALPGIIPPPNALPGFPQGAAPKTFLEIRLLPTGVVRGRVMEGETPIAASQVELSVSESVLPKAGQLWPPYPTYADPVPPPNAAVGPNALPPVEGRPQPVLTLTDRDWAETDENGCFEFPFVEPGKKFEIHVCTDRFVAEGRQGQVVAGRTLHVRPFSLLRLDESVAGTVVDTHGNPLAGVSVGAFLRSGESIPRAVTRRLTGKNGRFSIAGVPAAPLTITAYIQPPEDPRYGPLDFSAEAQARPGQMDVRIVLDLKRMQGKKEKRHD